MFKNFLQGYSLNLAEFDVWKLIIVIENVRRKHYYCSSIIWILY